MRMSAANQALQMCILNTLAVRYLLGVVRTPDDFVEAAGINHPRPIISEEVRPRVPGAHAADLGHRLMTTGLSRKERTATRHKNGRRWPLRQ